MSESIRTIQKEAEFRYVVERSAFIARSRSIKSKEQIREEIEEISSLDPNATHRCSAFRMGSAGQIEYADDDGEPSGTAGRPILGAIRSHNLTDVLVVVTRYFGGKKLGVRGLIDAYRTATEQVLSFSGSVPLIPAIKLKISCGYDQLERIQYILQQYQAKIEHSEYLETVTLRVVIHKDEAETFREAVQGFAKQVETL